MKPDPVKVARQHVQRGGARRRSKMYYLHHRSAIKQRAKRRYKRVHSTGAFRHQLLHRHLHPGMHHRIHASFSLNLPFWSPFEGDGVVVGLCSVDVQYRLLDGSGTHSCFYEDFLIHAVFVEEGDIEILFQALDTELGIDPTEVVESAS